MPRTVACLHHLEQPFLGTAEAPLRAAGLVIDERRPALGDPLPELGEIDGIISFGGSESARDVDHDQLLSAETALLRDAAGAGLPVLGICLGAQLLARALGAEVRRAPRRTVAWLELEPLPAAAQDPLAAALPVPLPVLHWNEDVFDLPPGATELLARPGEGVEAFRAGSAAWGVQFHPEIDAAALDGWYARYGGWLGEAGLSEAEARAADARYLPGQAALGERLFGAFAAVVAR